MLMPTKPAEAPPRNDRRLNPPVGSSPSFFRSRTTSLQKTNFAEYLPGTMWETKAILRTFRFRRSIAGNQRWVLCSDEWPNDPTRDKRLRQRQRCYVAGEDTLTP